MQFLRRFEQKIILAGRLKGEKFGKIVIIRVYLKNTEQKSNGLLHVIGESGGFNCFCFLIKHPTPGKPASGVLKCLNRQMYLTESSRIRGVKEKL